VTGERRKERDVEAVIDEISRILFDMDPMGLNFESNDDEYDGEAIEIAPRLPSCRSEGDVREVLLDYIAGDEKSATAREEAAKLIWVAWQRRLVE
jgi:hypothetical protein